MIDLTKIGKDSKMLAFDTLGEALAQADKRPSKNWGATGSDISSKEKSEERTEFTGTKSWEENKRIAELGWSDGRALVDASLTSIFDTGAAQLANAPQVQHAIAGAYPDVPLYCAGEIACMINDAPEENGGKKIIKLVIDFGCPFNVKAQSLANRGAALAGLVDEIESAGHRCEVWGVHVSASKQYRKRKNGKVPVKYFGAMICAKSAGEPLDIDRVAYTIGHPSAFRRVYFALLENEPFTDKSGYEGGYGISTRIPDAALENDVFYFPPLAANKSGLEGFENEKNYGTPEKAMNRTREVYQQIADRRGAAEVAQ